MPPNRTDLPERIHVLGRATLLMFRMAIATCLLFTAGAAWLLTRRLPPTATPVPLYLSLLILPIMAAVLWRAVRRSDRSAIAYDEEGIWRFAEPRHRGLVRWRDVARVVESDRPGAPGPLMLRDAEDNDLLAVSKSLEDYMELRMVICRRSGRQVEAVRMDGFRFGFE